MYLIEKTIGERIESLRKDMSMSQTELAQKIGVSVSAVSKYEKGVITPKEKVMIAICVALNVPYSVLAYGLSSIEVIAKKNGLALIISGLDGKEHTEAEQFAAQAELSAMSSVFRLNQVVYEEQNKAKMENLPWERIGEVIEFERNNHPIVELFSKLNGVGQSEAIKRLDEMTRLEEYTTKDGD